jgi:hypothetical protein
MEYYIHPPEHDAAQYQQYEYSNELLQAPHEESSIVNVSHCNVDVFVRSCADQIC